MDGWTEKASCTIACPQSKEASSVRWSVGPSVGPSRLSEKGEECAVLMLQFILCVGEGVSRTFVDPSL